MRTHAGLHADQARRHIGKPCFNLATRPLLTQHDCTAAIETDDVERVLADIDTDYSNYVVEIVRHSVLLVFGAPCQLRSLTGQEHGRTIPLADMRGLPAGAGTRVIVLATAASTSSESKSILAHPVKPIFILALFAIPRCSDDFSDHGRNWDRRNLTATDCS